MTRAVPQRHSSSFTAEWPASVMLDSDVNNGIDENARTRGAWRTASPMRGVRRCGSLHACTAVVAPMACGTTGRNDSVRMPRRTHSLPAQSVDKRDAVKSSSSSEEIYTLQQVSSCEPSDLIHIISELDPQTCGVQCAAALFLLLSGIPGVSSSDPRPPLRKIVLLVLGMEGSGDINTPRDFSGDSLLHVASRKGLCSVVWLLLRHGADVNTLNTNSETPLHAACATAGKLGAEHKNSLDALLKVVEMLVADGADNYVDNCGNTPLHLARGPIVSFLLAKSFSCERNDARETPLHMAAKRGDVEGIGALLEADISSLDWVDIDQKTPLYVAAENGMLHCVSRLLDSDADVDRANVCGETPLHAATKGGHERVIRELLSVDGNIDSRDEEGRTPLIVATLLGHVGVVITLLHGRADVSVRCQGKLPLEHAVRCNYNMMMVVLIDATKALIPKSSPRAWLPRSPRKGRDLSPSHLPFNIPHIPSYASRPSTGSPVHSSRFGSPMANSPRGSPLEMTILKSTSRIQLPISPRVTPLSPSSRTPAALLSLAMKESMRSNKRAAMLNGTALGG